MNTNLPDVVVTIDEFWLNFIVSVFLPMIVALVTKRFASSNVKSYTLLFLSIITGWLTSLYATGGTFELKAAVVSVFVSFVTAVGVHYGLLKNSITGAGGAIARTAPGGLGGNDPVKEADSQPNR